MKKNGFVLMETIIVTAIISIFLITSFSFTYMTIKKYEIRQRYDQIDSVYALNSLKMFLYRFTDLNKILDGLDSSNYIELDSKIEYIDSVKDEGKNFYTNLKTTINIEKVYISKLDSPSKISTTDQEFNDYLKTVDIKSTESNTEFRLIGKFNDGNYATINIYRVNEG